MCMGVYQALARASAMGVYHVSCTSARLCEARDMTRSVSKWGCASVQGRTGIHSKSMLIDSKKPLHVSRMSHHVSSCLIMSHHVSSWPMMGHMTLSRVTARDRTLETEEWLESSLVPQQSTLTPMPCPTHHAYALHPTHNTCAVSTVGPWHIVPSTIRTHTRSYSVLRAILSPCTTYTL